MMSAEVPQGFQVTGVHCGVKSDSDREDLTLVVCPGGAVAAGVYTQNAVVAAPVLLDRERTPSRDIRAVVVNSGNANACTGAQGLEDAREMARLAAEACGAEPQQTLVMSTGVIGQLLPMDKIAEGVSAAAGRLGDDSESLIRAAWGMTTTDRSYKLAGRRLRSEGREIRISAMAKGAGMIGPNMATMLAVVMTDASLSPDAAQRALVEAVDRSFNCTSVEGHTSTNDTVVLLASGAAGAPLEGPLESAFQAALKEVCIDLAREIADDGEGASHLITLDVRGCASRPDALRIAKTVAASPLVKTAIAGADPNWGRILSAAGYAGVSFDPAAVTLAINGCLLYQRGTPAAFDPAAVSRSIAERRETWIELQFSEGDAGVRFWTSDLTPEYVRFNSDYHT